MVDFPASGEGLSGNDLQNFPEPGSVGNHISDPGSEPQIQRGKHQRRLVFQLDNTPDCVYACETSYLSGVIALPEIFKVPRTHSWFLGLSGHRGRLVTINDLSAYLFGQNLKPGKSARILIFDCSDFLFGFIVNSILGFRDFFPHNPSATSKKISDNMPLPRICLPEIEPIKRFTSETSRENQTRYLELDFESITRSREFLGISALK